MNILHLAGAPDLFDCGLGAAPVHEAPSSSSPYVKRRWCSLHAVLSLYRLVGLGEAAEDPLILLIESDAGDRLVALGCYRMSILGKVDVPTRLGGNLVTRCCLADRPEVVRLGPQSGLCRDVIQPGWSRTRGLPVSTML